MGFEPHRAEVVPGRQPHVGVEGSGQSPQEGDSGFGAALFNALNFINRHASPSCQLDRTKIEGAALVVDGFAER